MNQVQPISDDWAVIPQKPPRNKWSVFWQTAQNAAALTKSFFIHLSPYETVRSSITDRELLPVLKTPLFPLALTGQRNYQILDGKKAVEPTHFYSDILAEMGDSPFAWAKTQDGEDAIVAQYEQNYQNPDLAVKVLSAFLANGGTQEEAVIPKDKRQYFILAHDPKKSERSRNMSRDQLFRDHHGLEPTIEAWNHRFLNVDDRKMH